MIFPCSAKFWRRCRSKVSNLDDIKWIMENIVDAFKSLMVTVTILVTAYLSIISVVPFLALSCFGFPTVDDLIMFTTVKRDGIAYTLDWYNTHVTGRMTSVLFHSALAKLTILYRSDPWIWNAAAAFTYYSLVVAVMVTFIRTAVPKIPFGISVVWASVHVAGTMIMAVDGYGIGTPSQPLWPMVLALYTFSFTLFPLVISAMIIAWDRDIAHWIWSSLLVALVFMHGVSHEVVIVGLGAALLIFALRMFRVVGFGSAVVSHGHLSRVRLGVSLRNRWDSPIFFYTLLALGAAGVAAAAVHLLSPSMAARGAYWAAQMTWAEAVVEAVPIALRIVTTPFDIAPPVYLAYFGLSVIIGLANPLRESLSRDSRFILLIPIVMFLLIAFVSTTASLVMLGRDIPRVVHSVMLYGGLAVGCFGLFVGSLVREYVWSRGLRSLLEAGAAVVMVGTIYTDPYFVARVKEVTGPAMIYGGGTLGRVGMLAEGRDRVVYLDELERPTPSIVPTPLHPPRNERKFTEHLAYAWDQAEVVFLPCGESEEPLICHYRYHPLDGATPEIIPEGGYEGPAMERQREREARRRPD